MKKLEITNPNSKTITGDLGVDDSLFEEVSAFTEERIRDTSSEVTEDLCDIVNKYDSLEEKALAAFFFGTRIQSMKTSAKLAAGLVGGLLGGLDPSILGKSSSTDEPGGSIEDFLKS